MPVSGEPYVGKHAIFTSFTFPYGIEGVRSLFVPLIDLVPELLPSSTSVIMLTTGVTCVKAVIHDMC
jgi:hypothetical protein